MKLASQRVPLFPLAYEVLRAYKAESDGHPVAAYFHHSRAKRVDLRRTARGIPNVYEHTESEIDHAAKAL